MSIIIPKTIEDSETINLEKIGNNKLAKTLAYNLFDRLITFSMNLTHTMLTQHFLMQFSAITLMPIKSIFWVLIVIMNHNPISCYFSNHRGGCNTPNRSITANYALLRQSNFIL